LLPDEGKSRYPAYKMANQSSSVFPVFSGTFPMATAAAMVRNLLGNLLGTRDISGEKNVPVPHYKQYRLFSLVYH
jgi:hypothetical protein